MKIATKATPENNNRGKEQVRAYCKLFGTQKTLSQKTGIPQSYISKWLNKEDEAFSVERLTLIRQAIGLPGTVEQWNED